MEPGSYQIEFILNGIKTTIECKADEKMKDIFKTFKLKVNAQDKILIFLYNGIYIQNEEEKTVNEISNKEDKKRSKMSILVNEEKDQPIQQVQDCIIKSNNIICPECYEDTNFTIEGYVINLSGCKNNHDIDNIFLDKFDSTQNINISKITCQDCKKYNKGNVDNNIFYKCITCKKNLCTTCKIKHDKNHNIINYDDKNYICEQHNEVFCAYCKKCQKNICKKCKDSIGKKCNQTHDENNKNIINYDELSPKDEKIVDILKQLEQLEKVNNKLKNDIDGIIEKLNKIKENFEIYYNINKKIFNNFNKNKKKLNYEILNNFNQIINITTPEVIKDINNINNINNIYDKFKSLINIYNLMTSNNAISIIYNFEKDDNDRKLFGHEFIENNKKKCKMIINNTKYNLDNNKLPIYNTDNIVIRLKGIKNITNMSEMFCNCSSLSSLPDISKLYISNINNMSCMFQSCSSLKSLPDISLWDTSNVNNMKYMFGDCFSLLSLPDLSKWNISNVNNMDHMFANCTSLLSLPDLSKWNTSKVNNMNSMFSNCSSLISLPDISKWNISNVNSISNMFYLCESLSSLPDIKRWNTNNITNMSHLFQGCKSLFFLPDISEWGIEKLVDVSSMLYKCSALSYVHNLSKWNDKSKIKNNDNIFEECYNLIDVPKIEKKTGIFKLFGL